MKQANKQTSKLIGTLMALGALVIPAQAAVTATSAGTQLDLPEWRTSTVDKPLDPDGDDVIGTLGYHLFGAEGERSDANNGANGPLASLPGYITVTGNTSSELQYGYASIDNPVDGTPASIISGTLSGTGAIQNIATIDFSAGVPSALTMTLMNDNLDGVVYNVDGYTIRASNGTTILATISGPNDNNNPDWHFVELSGLEAGSQVQVWGTGGDYPTLGGVTFDAIPEPSTTALLGLGGFALILRRRR